MTNPVDIAESQRQINAAREQTHANIATSQGWAEIASEGAEIATEKSALAVSAASTAVASKDAALDYRNQSQVFAQTLNQRVDTGGQEIAYMSDGRPYLLEQAAVNIPLRVDNSVGTRVFLGNTVIHSDTGWRNLSSNLVNGWAGLIYLRRVGDTVFVRGHDLDPVPSTAIHCLDLPAGFAGTFRHPIPAYVHNQTWVYSRVIQGILQLDRTSTPGVKRDLTGSFPTSHLWPTTLPGTPA